jgi:hypothetical protein
VSATRPGHFSFRRVAFCSLPLLGLALWMLALDGLANAGGTATAEQPARVSVQVPSAVKGAGVAMLELSIAVVRRPPAGQLGAQVRVRQNGGGAVDLGRISILAPEQRYQFNVGGMLRPGTADVEVALIDRGGGPPPAGAELSIGHARIVTR